MFSNLEAAKMLHIFHISICKFNVKIEIYHFENCYLPFGQISVPVRMNYDCFHRGELLTAVKFKQAVLTNRHTVLTNIRADGDRERKRKETI